jgi:hypothetical protein
MNERHMAFINRERTIAKGYGIISEPPLHPTHSANVRVVRLDLANRTPCLKKQNFMFSAADDLCWFSVNIGEQTSFFQEFATCRLVGRFIGFFATAGQTPTGSFDEKIPILLVNAAPALQDQKNFFIVIHQSDTNGDIHPSPPTGRHLTIIFITCQSERRKTNISVILNDT